MSPPPKHQLYWTGAGARRLPLVLTLADGQRCQVRIRRGHAMVLRILVEARNAATHPFGGHLSAKRVAEIYARQVGRRDVSEFTITEYVFKLRCELRQAVAALASELPVPELIVTDPGVGYRIGDCELEIVGVMNELE